MKENSPGGEGAESRSLRERAEARLHTTRNDVKAMSPEEVERLVHELQIHQIELEIQNEEMRQTHIEVANSRDRFSDLYEFAPVGYFTLGKQGTILRCNLTGAEMLGLDRRALLGRRLSDLVARDAQDDLYLHLQAVFESEQKQCGEFAVCRPDGETRIFRAESRRVPDRGAAGELVSHTAVIDLTERRRAEEALVKSQERLRLAAEATGFGTYDYDPQTRRSIWSPQLHSMCGTSETTDMDSPSIMELVHADDQARFAEMVQRSLDPAGSARHELEFRIVRPDGEVRWVRDTGQSYFAEREGKRVPVRVVGTVEDITERKVAEEELRQFNETLERRVEERSRELRRMSQVFRDATDPIIIHDMEGTILDVNAEMERLFGWSRDELIGQSLKMVVPEDRHEQVDDLLARCRRGEAVQNVEGVRLTKDGEHIPVLLTKSLLSDGGGDEPSAIANIAKDLRELKQTEAELLESRALAEMHRDIAYMANRARDIDEAVHFCLERVSFYNGWAFGHAYFPAPDDPQCLQSTASCYMQDAKRFEAFRQATLQLRLKRGEGLPGRVFATGRAQWTCDLEQLTARSGMAEELGLATAAVFPILVRDEVVGVLEFLSEEVIEVDPRLEESMASIGAQLGRVIERHEAERRLIASEARLRQITDQLRDVVWMRDAESLELLYCNAAFETIFGRPRSELDASSGFFLDSVDRRDRERMSAALEKLKEGEEVDESLRIVRPDGATRWLRCRGYPVRDEAGRIYRFAGTAEDITERKAAEREMRRLEREISAAGEEERRRIAQDIHDSVGSLLTAINLRLNIVGEEVAGTNADTEESIGSLTSMLEQAITQTRMLTRGLYPVGDDPGDLVPALRDLAAAIESNGTLECGFVCPGPVRIENCHAANQLYRIAQEAANNAVKHSGGSRLNIELSKRNGRILLIVRDDGKGFDPEADLPHSSGFGLRIMQYRANEVGASLRIAPCREGGTRVICKLPCESGGAGTG